MEQGSPSHTEPLGRLPRRPGARHTPLGPWLQQGLEFSCNSYVVGEVRGLFQSLSHRIPQMPCSLDTLPVLQMEKADFLY